MKLSLVIVAGGSGQRVGGDTPKQYLELNGLPVFGWSVRSLSPVADELVLVVPPGDETRIAEVNRSLLDLPIPVRVVAGGAVRQESVRSGVLVAAGDYVAVHDAARPLATAELLRRVWAAAQQSGAAIPVVPIADSVKEVVDGRVARHVNRANLRAAQTPQVFLRATLLKAFGLAEADRTVFTDEAGLLGAYGIDVAVVDGEADNIKVTYPRDMAVAMALMQRADG
jgi:2-C-methyl-D-erythritol 4-phosphate cytidylyltransferase